MNRQKWFSEIFRVRKDIREKNMSAICEVVDYPDTVSAWLLTTVRRHNIDVVVDYTFGKNFEGFSQILKEQ